MHRELVKGTLDAIILQLLHKHDWLYGYQITKMVHEQSGGELSIKEGSLYPSLHKLEKQQLIRSKIEYVKNRPRKYYAITKTGREQSILKLEEIDRFMQVMRTLLNLKSKNYGLTD